MYTTSKQRSKANAIFLSVLNLSPIENNDKENKSKIKDENPSGNPVTKSSISPKPNAAP